MHGSHLANSYPQRILVAGIVCCLLLCVAAIYGQTLAFQRISYDDALYIYNSPEVCAGLTGHGFRWAFTNGPVGERYPLAMLSHMLDCQIYGLEPWGHHLTNLLLHAAASVGLFWVLYGMTGQLWPSALVAAIFAAHPQHVESVAWLSERRDVLCGLWFVLTLGAYVGYVRHDRSWGRYALVALALTMSLLAKPTTVTLPPLLLVLDWWPLRRFGAAEPAGDVTPAPPRHGFWRLVAEKLPLLAIAVAAAAVTLATHAETTKPVNLPLAERLANAPIALVTYVVRFFYPADLSPFYPFPADGYPIWEVAGASAILLAVTLAAIVWRRRFPYLIVGWFWFLGMTVPVMGVVNVQDHAMADRYTYLSTIGLSIATVWGIAQLAAALRIDFKLVAVGWASAIVILVLLAARQTTYWHDDLSLWQRVSAMTEDNQKVEIGLAGALHRANRLDEAIEHYQRALSWLAWADLVNHYGTALAQNGHLDLAAGQFRRAIELDPSSVEPEMNLGVLLVQQGRLDEAAEHFRRAIALNSHLSGPHFHLANLLLAQKEFAQATDEFRKTVDLEPNFEVAYLGLAAALAAQERIPEAIDQYRAALKIAPDNAVARAELERLLHLQSGSTKP